MMHPYASESIAVSTTGSIAFQILSEARAGRVAAVFERSFYADFNGLFVCFGGAEIGNGPLNALVDRQWRDIGLRVGDSAVVGRETVRINDRRVLDFSRADMWRMPERPAEPNAARVSDKLDTLVQTISPLMPAGGLATLLRSPSQSGRQDPLLRYVSQPFGALKAWLDACLDCHHDRGIQCPGELRRLIGAGPGLTPSGDDLLVGVMATLHRLGKYRALMRLSNHIRADIERRTNAISAAHLSAAMEGFTGESIISVIDELIFARTIETERLARRLDQIGSTSGWDTFVGVVAVLEYWSKGYLADRRDVHAVAS